MNTRKIYIILLVSIMTVMLSSFSWAGSSDGKYCLMHTKMHPGADGTATINKGNINIATKGLKPNSVYTVWFVNMKPKKHETGAGAPPYMFKTDANGNGNYSAPLSESPVGKWEMLMVVLHPNGNPKDMKNMVGALSSDL